MTWYEIAEVVLAAALLVFVVVMVVSPPLRARTRVLLRKRLFTYKYDYRREWLRFIGTLSVSGEELTIIVNKVGRKFNNGENIIDMDLF